MDEKKEIGVYAPEVLGTAKLVGVFESGTSEWHKAREDGIGGSEVGAVLGLSQYESPFSLWAKKTGKVESDFVDNWSTRFGRAFEMPILKLWAEQHPDWEVFSTGTYSHAENPWMKANPDAIGRHRVTGELMVIEIKTARYSWNETPPAYQAQVMHYMDVLGIKRGIIVAVAGWNWVEIAVEYDEFLAAMNRTILKKFWWHVINDVAPEYDGADATYQAVRKMHRKLITMSKLKLMGCIIWHWHKKQPMKHNQT